MLKQFCLPVLLLMLCGVNTVAQQGERGRPRRTDNPVATPSPTPKPTPKPTPVTTKTKPAAPKPTNPVLAAFETLLEGIRNADAAAVNAIYADTPQFLVFNYNGTVTRSWQQMSDNRKSAYEQAQNVKLDVRDVKLTMLGKDAAVVTCLWTQAQDFRGAPESSSGRMTLVFRLIKTKWKIVHLHTSPESPDPSRLVPSERRPS